MIVIKMPAGELMKFLRRQAGIFGGSFKVADWAKAIINKREIME